MKTLQRFTKAERHKIYSYALERMNATCSNVIIEEELGICYFLNIATNDIMYKKKFSVKLFYEVYKYKPKTRDDNHFWWRLHTIDDVRKRKKILREVIEKTKPKSWWVELKNLILCK